MAFTVCTETPIYRDCQVIWIEQLPYNTILHAKTLSDQQKDGNHESKSNLLRECTRYVNAINHYFFLLQGRQESLICFLLKLCLKLDHVQSISDWW